MTHYVLVHGAFHGGWCWAQVAEGLRNAGHTVSTPDLPGAGDDSTPLDEVTFETAVERVVETLKSSQEPAVLVGHSMGGVVTTQAATRVPERVARLVYLAAFRPLHGESVLDLTQLPEGAGDGVQRNITIDGEPPVATFDREQAESVFYNGVPADLAQEATGRLCLQPLAVFATPVQISEADLPPQEYVICAQDRAIPPALQHLMATRTQARVHELDAGHSPFFSHPAEVLAILLDEVQALDAAS